MKYIKTFESYEDKVKVLNSTYLLCVNPPYEEFYWKFTKGKKYKIYVSTSMVGVRLRDDKLEYWNMPLDFEDLSNLVRKEETIEFEYNSSIFTTDESLEDYEIRKNANKYNL